MIEFTGVLSGAAKKFVIKKYKQSMLIGVLVVSLLFGIPAGIIGVSVNKIFLIALIPLSLLFVIPLITPSDEFIRLVLPTKVLIDFEERTVVVSGDGFERFKMFDDIVKIEARFWGYYLVFSAPHKDLAFTIQKDLIIHGDIEQFENEFKHLIVHLEME